MSSPTPIGTLPTIGKIPKKMFAFGDTISFDIDSIEDLKDLRESERIYYSEKENIYLKILNPYDKMTMIKKTIIEMSEGGLSIRTDIDSRLFQSGNTIKSCQIYKNGTLLKSRDLEVIYAQRLICGQREKYLQVGFKFIS